jgi:23S rRNA (adenine2503-C2)-methyltransferase
MDARIHLLGLTRDELGDRFAPLGLAAYRADQVRQWVFGLRRVDDWSAMTNLSKLDRQRLAERFIIAAGRVVSHQVSDDGVHKLLLGWAGGANPDSADSSDAVLIPEERALRGETDPDDADSDSEEAARDEQPTRRRTVCISTQVGCPVGCRFCASGIGGLKRNLTAGQIVEQVWQLARTAIPADERISNVVIMGIGEPLANYDAVVRAIRLVNAPDGMNIGARKITLSTVGVPAQMRRLAAENLQITLAISLHASNQNLRAELVPWAAKFPLDEVLAAAREYFETTGREITLEYVLLEGVNAAVEQADELADLARSLRCNVNLIRYNPVVESGFHRTSQATTLRFRDRLQRRGVNVHIRPSRGLTIDAACGQLRRRAIDESNPA